MNDITAPPKSNPSIRALRQSLSRCGPGLLALGAILVSLFIGLDSAHAGADRGPKPADERVIVLVPGITGTALRDRASGRTAWGDGPSLLRPRDSGHDLALPVRPSHGPLRLEPFAIIERIRLGIVRMNIYRPIIRAFEKAGYRRGRLSRPAADQSFFTFAYDWRVGNSQAVRQLYDQLDALRQLRGEERLPLALICQSNGAHICRYLAKFGKATLEQVEAGRSTPPDIFNIQNIVLIGTANGGSVRVLSSIDRGRRYVPIVGRYMRPETLFTFPTLYQDLPAYRDDLFIDADGNSLDLDLYEPATWRDYNISIFSPEAARRLAKSPIGRDFGTEKERLEFLGRVLNDARRTQAVLQQDVEGFGDIRYDLIQNVDMPTPEKAVVVRKEGGEPRFRLLFTGDKEIDKNPKLAAIASSPGDGHATVTSQNWLSPQEKASIPCETFNVEGTHFGTVVNPRTIERLVELLTGENENFGCG